MIARFKKAEVPLPPVFVTVGGEIDIVEYHDCQRLVRAALLPVAGQLVYGPRAAIFRLDPAKLGGRVAAVIWNLDFKPSNRYPELAILSELSCVFVDSAADGRHARIVPVYGQADCPTVVASPGIPLWVRVATAPGALLTNYPDVARWDYDPVNHRNNIGIKCGAAWCEVGLDNAMATSPVVPAASTGVRDRIKGWFDQQSLAEILPNQHPGTVTGTLFPDVRLSSYTNTPFPTGTWIRVAVAKLDATSPMYRTKLGLMQGENVVEICNVGPGGGGCATGGGPSTMPVVAPGDCSADPTVGWFGRITPPAGTGPPRTFCVTQHPHMGMSVPASARWAWRENDELIWTACGTACCRVH